MDKQPPDQEREYYRLQYPLAERPQILIGDQTFEITEISEQGARIAHAGSALIHDGGPFHGVVQFRDETTESIAGVVLRSDQEEFVVSFSQGITLKRMMAEQIRLRQKYPEPKSSADQVSDDPQDD